MKKHVVTVRDSDGAVVNLRRDETIPAPGGGLSYFEVNDEDYNKINDSKRTIDMTDIYRWRRTVGGVIEKNPDPRRRIKFDTQTVKVAVGDTPPSVELHMLKTGGGIDTAFNGTEEVLLNDRPGRISMSLTFVSGICPMTIPTAFAYEGIIRRCKQFRLANGDGLRVRVLATDFGFSGR